MTGLQASDLTKAKKKQKAEVKQSAIATPPPNQMAGMHAGQMMQHLGYAAAGNQAMTMTPMGFPSSMASALPHFQQIWSAGQMYDQNQVNQMQLMAAQAQQQAQQQATNMMMAGQQNGAAFFQQQQAQQTQVQQQAQQPGQPQQAQAGQPQQAQQQTAADGTTVYNGSPQMQSTASPHLNSTSPLNITPQPAAADQQQQQQNPQAFEAQISDNSATAATTASTTWSWHDPNAQGQPQQFNVAGQNGPTTQDNGLIAAAAQQAFGESQQQQDNTRRMSNEISQANVGTPQGSEGHRSGQPSPAQGDLGAAATAGGDGSNQAASDPQVQAQQAQSQSPQTSSPQQPVSNQGTVADPQQQAQAQAQQQQQFATVASAHVSYNSYANFPWGNFPAPADNSQGQNGEGEKTQVHSKETMLEAELHHLRSALSEKTKEVQRLGQELEKAYQMIEQLKASQANPGAVGSG